MSTLLRKTYSQLVLLPSIKERFDYLKIKGEIGQRTFGGDRYLNQALYQSGEWKLFRDSVIIRDNGCDMAMPGYEIIKIVAGHRLSAKRGDYIIVHHINPLSPDDIRKATSAVFDMNNAVCVSSITHRAIHFGAQELLPAEYIPRYANDTCPWRLLGKEN